MKFARLVIAGGVLSLVVHGAGSAYFAPDPEETLIAASSGGAVVVIGSLEDLVEGSDAPVEPVEAVVEEVEVQRPRPQTPVETPVEQVQVAAVQPQVQPVIQGVTDTAPVTATVVEEARPLEEVQPAKPVEVQPAQAVEPVTQAPVVEQTPVEQAPIEQTPVEVAAVQPVEQAIEPPVEEEEVQVPEEVLAALPLTKPEPPEQKPEKRAEPKKPAKPRGTTVSSRKGADTRDPNQRQAARQGAEGGAAEQQGNAARSNYNGLVQSRISRAKRYVRDRNLRGKVQVAFVVSRNGAVSNIRIAGSSGDARADKAALYMVQRAGRMPDLPPEFPGTSKAFSIPIRFE